jgi:hypothetical protein
MLCSFGVDSTRAKKQAKDLASLLKLQFPDGLSEQLLCDLSRLRADIVICKKPATVLTREGNQILIRFHFGERYESLMAALRTGEKSSVAHALDSLSEHPATASV